MNILISPSGKRYGSEQVLIDYLYFTKLKFSIFVNGKGELYNELKSKFDQHSVFRFGYVQKLYFKIFFLCLKNKIKAVYVNEAGHSRYIYFLSRCFPKVKFILHVRLIEDTSTTRWGRFRKPGNITVISVSKFISAKLPVKNIQLYDPFIFGTNDLPVKQYDRHGVFIIGVIGRLTASKGFEAIVQLVELINANNLDNKFHFQFYGDVMYDVADSVRFEKIRSFNNVKLNGFVSDKIKIYNSIHCVLHASLFEPLGRIFLEAIDFNKPLIGINNAGIGEIGGILNISALLADVSQNSISTSFLDKLIFLEENYETIVNDIISKKTIAADIFDPVKYSEKIDSLIRPL